MSHEETAATLIKDLDLSMPPVAVALCDEPPPGVPAFQGPAPAGCVFWEKAAGGAFATAAPDHALCAIGVHTHSLSGAPESQQGELQEALQAMAGLDYVRPEEAAALPVLSRSRRHAIYAPLAETPLDPDVVMLFLDARQSLILSEAAARVDGGLPPAMGRPACAAVPHAANSGRAALSLGCCGARAYLDSLQDGVVLWALPGSRIADYAREVATLARANATLTAFHRRRRHDVAAGARPSVRQSLERLRES